jgi:hypothetical protein
LTCSEDRKHGTSWALFEPEQTRARIYRHTELFWVMVVVFWIGQETEYDVLLKTVAAPLMFLSFCFSPNTTEKINIELGLNQRRQNIELLHRHLRTQARTRQLKELLWVLEVIS